jgi:hypothetical protein
VNVAPAATASSAFARVTASTPALLAFMPAVLLPSVLDALLFVVVPVVHPFFFFLSSLFALPMSGDPPGQEYWSARDLQYMDFERAQRESSIAKAIIAATSPDIGLNREDHCSHVTTMIEIAKGARREIKDYVLSRDVCSFIAQNGDPVVSLQSVGTLKTSPNEWAPADVVPLYQHWSGRPSRQEGDYQGTEEESGCLPAVPEAVPTHATECASPAGHRLGTHESHRGER